MRQVAAALAQRGETHNCGKKGYESRYIFFLRAHVQLFAETWVCGAAASSSPSSGIPGAPGYAVQQALPFGSNWKEVRGRRVENRPKFL